MELQTFSHVTSRQRREAAILIISELYSKVVKTAVMVKNNTAAVCKVVGV